MEEDGEGVSSNPARGLGTDQDAGLRTLMLAAMVPVATWVVGVVVVVAVAVEEVAAAVAASADVAVE